MGSERMSNRQSESDSEEAHFLPYNNDIYETRVDDLRLNKWWRVKGSPFIPHTFLYIAILVNFVWSAANLSYGNLFQSSARASIFGMD